MYELGIGVPKNYAEAVKAYRRACAEADGFCYELARMYDLGTGVAKDRNKAIELYRKACNKNDQRACERLREIQ